MSKLVSSGSFGERFSAQYELGTLVSWSEWTVVNNNVEETVYYGTIVEKQTKILGGRGVSIVLVACSDSGDVISLNPFQLRVEATN
jgi:hypothetical protein